MRFNRTILPLMALSCSLWMTGCGGLKSTPVLHDSHLPILEVYDRDGHRLVGYEAYASGYVANQVKRCNALLDELERRR